MAKELSYRYSDLHRFDVRFLELEDGIIDVSGKFYSGYITVTEKTFHQERWCTFPFQTVYSLEEMRKELYEFTSLIDMEEKQLSINWHQPHVNITFSLEESIELLQEITRIINKMEKIKETAREVEASEVKQDKIQKIKEPEDTLAEELQENLNRSESQEPESQEPQEHQTHQNHQETLINKWEREELQDTKEDQEEISYNDVFFS